MKKCTGGRTDERVKVKMLAPVVGGGEMNESCEILVFNELEKCFVVF